MSLIINQSCSSASYSEKDVRMKKILNSPNFEDGKFRNAVEWNQPGFGSMLGTAWDFLFTGNDRTPGDTIPVVQADLTNFISSEKDQLNTTWLGHSTLLINIDGYKIITDPVFEQRVSFFGPSRYNGDVPLDVENIPDIDVTIISHNHYDHLNIHSVELLTNNTKLFIVPLGVGAELEANGVPRKKIIELDWWDEDEIFSDLKIVATPSQHFSGRGLSDRNKTLWASWVIESTNHKIFFSGDSGYFEGFKEIGNKYGPFNMTFLESGAYNEKWHHIHMYPEETVQAHIDLKGEILHPVHWATFNLSLHPWYEPMDRLISAAWKYNVKVAMPRIGETTVYNSYIPKEMWWEDFIIDDN